MSNDQQVLLDFYHMSTNEQPRSKFNFVGIAPKISISLFATLTSQS